MDTGVTLAGYKGRGKATVIQWPQLMHRTVSKRLLKELRDTYSDYHFEILTVFEKSKLKETAVDPARVRVFTDAVGVIVQVPQNGWK